MSYQDDEEGNLTLGILYREETGVSVIPQKKQDSMWMKIYNRYMHLNPRGAFLEWNGH